MQQTLSRSHHNFDWCFALSKLQLLFILTIVLTYCVVWVDFFPSVSPAWPIILLLGLYNAILNFSFLLNRHKTISKLESTETPEVCIIIPSHNEATVLPATVKKLLTQKYLHFQILVIEDRSTDNTRAVLEALQQELNTSQFRFLSRPPEAPPGKSAALNEALKHTQAELLLILDADGEIPNDFLQTVIPELCNETIAGLQAPKNIINQGFSALTRVQQYEYELDAGLQAGRRYLSRGVEFRGNGMLIKRHVVEELGGWTETSITDDLDLSTKCHMAGYTIAFVQHANVYEEGLTQWAPLFRQRVRWAHGSIQRYLQYGFKLAFASKAGVITRLESLCYSTTFILPVVLMLDVILMLSWHRHWLSWMGVWWLMAFSLFLSFSWHVWSKHHKNIFDVLRESLLSTLYMLTLWSPVVVQAILNILWQKQSIPSWVKSERQN